MMFALMSFVANVQPAAPALSLVGLLTLWFVVWSILELPVTPTTKTITLVVGILIAFGLLVLTYHAG